MIEKILEGDRELFLFLNGFHNAFFDVFFSIISYKYTWIPLYGGLIGFIFVKDRRNVWKALLIVCISVVCADQITSSVMKPYFERLRPCHEALLVDKMILVGSCGGRYGFASSHAANSFAVAGFFFCFFRDQRLLSLFLLLWACLVSYSRVYLGVHYPLDIFVGGGLGFYIACLWCKVIK